MATPAIYTGELYAGGSRAARAALSASGRGARTFLRLALGSTAGRIGLPIVIIHVFVAIFGPFLAPFPPTEFHLQNSGEDQLIGPTSEYWLGTDQFGRDVFSRVLSGARSLILISLCGALLGIFLGTVVGMGSGYQGGKVDEVVMRIVDGMMAFPGLLLAPSDTVDPGCCGRAVGMARSVLGGRADRGHRWRRLYARSSQSDAERYLEGEEPGVRDVCPAAGGIGGLHHLQGDTTQRDDRAGGGVLGAAELLDTHRILPGIPGPGRPTRRRRTGA